MTTARKRGDFEGEELLASEAAAKKRLDVATNNHEHQRFMVAEAIGAQEAAAVAAREATDELEHRTAMLAEAESVAKETEAKIRQAEQAVEAAGAAVDTHYGRHVRR